MMITVKMSLWEKILGWVMIAAHLFFLGIIVEIFFMYMGWDTESASGIAEVNIAYFLLGFVITGAIFARFLIRNLKTFRRSVKKSFLAILAGGAVLIILNNKINIHILNNLAVLSPAFICHAISDKVCSVLVNCSVHICSDQCDLFCCFRIELHHIQIMPGVFNNITGSFHYIFVMVSLLCTNVLTQFILRNILLRKNKAKG